MGASALYRLTNHLNANQSISIYKSLHDVNMCPVSHKMRQVDNGHRAKQGSRKDGRGVPRSSCINSWI